MMMVVSRFGFRDVRSRSPVNIYAAAEINYINLFSNSIIYDLSPFLLSLDGNKKS